MKNNIFDITRFGLLVRKRFTDTKSSLLYEVSGVAAVLCIIFGLMCIVASQNITAEAQGVLFVTGLVIMGFIYADRAFSDTKNRVRGMFYLSTPASRLEKLLVAILYTSILYPLAFLVIFLAVDGLFYLIVNSTGLITMESLSGVTFEKFGVIAQMLITFQAVYMLGSIWFGKRSLLKTTVAIVVFYGLMAVVAGIIIRTNLDQIQAFGESTKGVNLHIGSEDFFKGDWIEGICWLLPPFFWIVSYFRLSEKQI